MGVGGCGGGRVQSIFTQYLHVFVSNALLITTITHTFDSHPNTKMVSFQLFLIHFKLILILFHIICHHGRKCVDANVCLD